MSDDGIIFARTRRYTFYAVNYRGSLSFGQGSIRALKGRCGDVDVKDCLQVAMHAVSRAAEEDGIIDPCRLYFLGGSHSGFIGAHLAGQYFPPSTHDVTAWNLTYTYYGPGFE